MAQVAGLLVLNRMPDRDSKLVFLATVENAKFRRPVVPGDQLRIEVQFTVMKRRAVKFHATATVDGTVVAEADMMCTLVEKQPEPVAVAAQP
jgi:3-hydroxyacyl-[acyl-carrier-protein] dehydratase